LVYKIQSTYFNGITLIVSSNNVSKQG